MRRLINLFFRIRARSHDVYIEDLEQMLSDLLEGRDYIEREIAETTRRLLAAQELRDEFKRKSGLAAHDTAKGALA